jgi:hypothetical protein
LHTRAGAPAADLRILDIGVVRLDRNRLVQQFRRLQVHALLARGAGWTSRLHKKGGKQHRMPCHHAFAKALRAYVDATGIAEDRKAWLFRTARGYKADRLSELP